MDTAMPSASHVRPNKKGRVFTRPAGTFSTLEVSRFELLLRLSWLGRCRLRRRCLRSRLWRSGGSRRCWRGYPRLHVVSVNHSLSDVDRLSPPQHIALRPRLRCVHNNSEAVILGILHDHGRHLLQDAARDLLLLVPAFFLKILDRAIEKFLDRKSVV